MKIHLQYQKKIIIFKTIHALFEDDFAMPIFSFYNILVVAKIVCSCSIFRGHIQTKNTNSHWMTFGMGTMFLYILCAYIERQFYHMTIICNKPRTQQYQYSVDLRCLVKTFLSHNKLELENCKLYSYCHPEFISSNSLKDGNAFICACRYNMNMEYFR